MIKNIASLLISILFIPMLSTAQDSNKKYHLLVGTYTSGKSEGIYVFKFDPVTGDLTQEHVQKDVENPSFVIFGPNAEYVYAVNEVSGDKQGMVSSFKFNKSTGELEFINTRPSKGGDPCYLETDRSGQHLFVGNYTGGNFSVIPINADGSLSTHSQTVQHEGSSINKSRQEKAHVHSTVLTPDEKYLFVGDLGTDRVYAYPYNPEDNRTPVNISDVAAITVKPGTGPRHIIFDEQGEYAYLVQELTAQLGVFKHDNGKLTLLQTVSLTEPDFDGEVSAAEVRISPDGNFLYASNRGEANQIVVFSIDSENGELSFVDRVPSGGKTPRNFIIDPTGNYLLAAHQNSDSIVIFKRDQQTGKITPTGRSVEVGNPVYLTMTPVE